MTEQEIKNNKIKETMSATLNRRKQQFCRVYEIKIQKNALSSKQKEQLKMIFIEAKWLYNDILNYSNASEENRPSNYKIGNIVKVKQKDGTFIERELKNIGSQMKQSVQKQICSQIKGLSVLKKHNHKVGRLKFLSDFTSIDLKQYGSTYKIYNDHKMKVQGIHGKIRVNGIRQIGDNVEFANAKLVKRNNDYYIMITTFTDNAFKKRYSNNKDIGIDMGCSTALTFSDGRKVDVIIEETERLKHLQQAMFKKKKGSNNRRKTIQKLNKEYQKLSNLKNDITNKIVAELGQNYRYIVIQDEQLHNWHKGGHGKAIQHSVLGRIKSKLKTKSNCIVISKWLPSSKLCFHCGQKNTELKLWDRIFICPECGCATDRDVHAALNILKFGLEQLVATEHSNFKPVEMETSIQSNLNKYLSMKQEDSSL